MVKLTGCDVISVRLFSALVTDTVSLLVKSVNAAIYSLKFLAASSDCEWNIGMTVSAVIHVVSLTHGVD